MSDLNEAPVEEPLQQPLAMLSSVSLDDAFASQLLQLIGRLRRTLRSPEYAKILNAKLEDCRTPEQEMFVLADEAEQDRFLENAEKLLLVLSNSPKS